MWLGLSLMVLNQSITDWEFLHWLTPVRSLILLLISSRIILLTLTLILLTFFADFKISRRKSTEQKIGNLLEVRAPETIFSGKCGLRA